MTTSSLLEQLPRGMQCSHLWQQRQAKFIQEFIVFCGIPLKDDPLNFHQYTVGRRWVDLLHPIPAGSARQARRVSERVLSLALYVLFADVDEQHIIPMLAPSARGWRLGSRGVEDNRRQARGYRCAHPQLAEDAFPRLHRGTVRRAAGWLLIR